MRNVIAGTIGTLFGLGLLSYSLWRGVPFVWHTTPISHWYGAALGGLMILAGLWAMVSGIQSLNAPMDPDRPGKKRRGDDLDDVEEVAERPAKPRD